MTVTTQIEDMLRRVTKGEETIIDVVQQTGTDGVPETRVIWGQRELQPEPRKEAELARAPAREHEFHDVKAFAAYIEREGTEDGTIVLGDILTGRFTAVLNENDPDDREIVSLVVMEHPLFKPWAAMLERPMSAQDFSLFIMRQRSQITDGQQIAQLFSMIRAQKTIETIRGKGTAFNSVKMSLQVGKNDTIDEVVELPDYLDVTVPLYIGSDPQQLHVDLVVDTAGDHAVIYGTASDIESKRVAAFEQMAQVLREQTTALVGMGKIKHRAWNFVR